MFQNTLLTGLVIHSSSLQTFQLCFIKKHFQDGDPSPSAQDWNATNDVIDSSF